MTPCEICERPATHCCGELLFCVVHAMEHAERCVEVLAKRLAVVLCIGHEHHRHRHHGGHIASVDFVVR
jgi:hypothetical protein